MDVDEARAELSRLLERVRAREQIVITVAGKPCARLVSLDPTPQRVLGRYRHRDGEVPDSVFAPLAQEDLEAWQDEG